MGTSAARSFFGVHSVTFKRRSDGTPYGKPLKIIASSGLDFSAEFEDLIGGSERYILESETTLINSEMALTVRQYEDFMFELFAGATVVQNAAESGGNVSTAVNKKGTSAINATTGIASVGVIPSTGAADLKYGRYLIKVKSATDINIVNYSDIDNDRGTDVDFQDDDLELLSADVTVPGTGGTVDIASLGLQITGGSGSIAMTIGDTAVFEVRPPNTGSSVITIGKSTGTFPQFGFTLYGQKRSNGQMVEIEVYKAVGGGLPMPFEEKTFHEAEITIKVLKDFDKDAVLEVRTVSPEVA